MAPPRVFISYSHKDDKALEQLQRFLKPLERDGLIDDWADTRIQAGEDWKDQIEAALDNATVAVLLISQDFLSSEFIYREEMPRILARRHHSDLTILPVFLSSSDAENQEFPFTDRQGKEQRAKLASIQGYGTPDKPLSEMTWSDRERVYQQLTGRIRKLIQNLVPPGAESPRAARPSSRISSAPPSHPAHEYPLTLHLEPHGNTCSARYVLPSGIVMESERDWQELRRKLEPLQTRLNETDNPTHLLQDAWEPYGSILFEALLGHETDWEPILRNLFHQPAPAPRPNPIRAPVRLRICTDDPLLLGMPWRLTSWKQYFLADHGWEFMTTQDPHPVSSCTTTAPANVLIVAPQTDVDGASLDPIHPQSMSNVLQQVWPTGKKPGYVRTVRTRQELENALSGMRPHLIYLYGHEHAIQNHVISGTHIVVLGGKFVALMTRLSFL